MNKLGPFWTVVAGAFVGYLLYKVLDYCIDPYIPATPPKSPEALQFWRQQGIGN